MPEPKIQPDPNLRWMESSCKVSKARLEPSVAYMPGKISQMERTWSVHSLAVPTESYLFLMSSSFSLTNIDHYGGPLALRNVI
jgi:hypothetical protein